MGAPLPRLEKSEGPGSSRGPLSSLSPVRADRPSGAYFPQVGAAAVPQEPPGLSSQPSSLPAGSSPSPPAAAVSTPIICPSTCSA